MTIGQKGKVGEVGMTDTEKALELVQKCLDDWPYAATRVVNIMTRLEKVKELLKEQEAKPVKIVKNVYNHEFYYCPNCDRQFYGFYKDPAYCDRCGQAVKWE